MKGEGMSPGMRPLSLLRSLVLDGGGRRFGQENIFVHWSTGVQGAKQIDVMYL